MSSVAVEKKIDDVNISIKIKESTFIKISNLIKLTWKFIMANILKSEYQI
jgi:hypothetical protein